jgi:NAD(P)-dependent dehydrogenase (short-subunit alcohol dehydrogenase family)
VNAIAPGPYRSDLVDASITAIPGFEEGMRDSTLLKRIAESDEILNPVFYLASEANTTGITLIADGGYMAGA